MSEAQEVKEAKTLSVSWMASFCTALNENAKEIDFVKATDLTVNKKYRLIKIVRQPTKFGETFVITLYDPLTSKKGLCLY